MYEFDCFMLFLLFVYHYLCCLIMPFETVVRKTIEYLEIPSVVGHEDFFLSYLLNDFKKLGLDVECSQNILAIHGKKPHAQIVTAHADRHGLISVGGDRYAYAAQYIKEQKYGETNKPSQAIMNAISDRFIGEDVFAYDAKTGEKTKTGTIMGSETDELTNNTYFLIDDIVIDDTDTPIAYARSAQSNGDLLKGQIDNVVSLGILYTLFQNGFQGTALISTEEEIGKSWIHIRDWLMLKDIETKQLIVLDTSPYREKSPIQNNQVILRNRDKSGVFHADFVNDVKRRCSKIGLQYQMKDEYFLKQGLTIPDLGSTELGRLVMETQGRWNGATIQIPTTEYHTSHETTSRGCIESYYRILSDLLIENPLQSH